MIARLTEGAALLAGAATLAIVLLISCDVTMRYFLDRPQVFVDELASFLEVLVVFGGAAYTFRAGGHVRVIVDKDEQVRDKLGFQFLEGPVTPKPEKLPAPKPKAKRRSPPRPKPKRGSVPKVPLAKV